MFTKQLLLCFPVEGQITEYDLYSACCVLYLQEHTTGDIVLVIFDHVSTF